MSAEGKREQAAIAGFVFQVCGRCGHPPSDGSPCIMGNQEHAETYPGSYVSFATVYEMASEVERLREAMTSVRGFLFTVRQVVPEDVIHQVESALHPDT